MKRLATIATMVVVCGLGAGCPPVWGQTAQEMQSAQPDVRPGETEEQHGKRLLDAMLVALGGEAWLNKRTQYVEGQTASFFSGQPTGSVVRYVQWKRYAQGRTAEATRVEFVSERGMIEPGTVRQVAHLWVDRQGYEYTFKGRTVLPQKQVTEYYRRQDHSLEKIMRDWVKAPGAVIYFAGSGERDRRPIDKVTILTADNDSATIEIEQGTHLPLQRSFETRNVQFKDHDLDEQVYGDWRMYDGIGTPMNTTDYHNGDMVSQSFLKKVKYNDPVKEELFDPSVTRMSK